MTKTVAIIGAGCSGLAAIKCCLDEGLQPVCFEKDNQIGGLWNYSDEVIEGRGSVYKSCVINTSKELMAFSDFPIPPTFPLFMPHEKVIDYFKLYADKFNICPYIRFETSVELIEHSDDHTETGQWAIHFRNTLDTEDGKVKMQIFDAVMICTGHHHDPYVPQFDGLADFSGEVLHSWSYKKSHAFVDKKVLVIGIGNSAVDIAVDLCNSAKEVHLSTRRGAWIMPKSGLAGIPNDAFGNNRLTNLLPEWMMHPLVEKVANITHFNHENLGLKPQHRGLEAFPTISDFFHLKLLEGKIHLKPDIVQFKEHQVDFTDGSDIECDCVIMSTGYNYTMPFIDNKHVPREGNNYRLYKYVFPPKAQHNTLAVIGMIQAIGAVMPISEMQCRWFCRVITDQSHLPQSADMLTAVETKSKKAGSKIATQRHALVTMWLPYMDELAAEIGCHPNLIQTYLSSPKLAMKCLFGPCVPAQYRLQGPGAWSGAQDVIHNTFTNMFVPTKQAQFARRSSVVIYCRRTSSLITNDLDLVKSVQLNTLNNPICLSLCLKMKSFALLLIVVSLLLILFILI